MIARLRLFIVVGSVGLLPLAGVAQDNVKVDNRKVKNASLDPKSIKRAEEQVELLKQRKAEQQKQIRHFQTTKRYQKLLRKRRRRGWL
jgi:hypothetical protein